MNIPTNVEDALKNSQKLQEEISRLRKEVIALKAADEQRERSEAALRESEGRFQATFEQAAVGIMHIAPDGHYLRINKKFCEIVGYTREELQKLNFQSITYPNDLEADLVYFNDLVAGKMDTYSIDKRYVRKDGSVVWANLTVSGMRGQDGQLKYLMGFVEGITKRKLAEASVRESREMLRLVMDNIPQRIFWKDTRSVYIGCNANFAWAAGVGSPEHIVGKTDYDLAWTRTEADSFRRDDREVMDYDRPKYHIIEPQLQADGRQSWLDTNKIPLHDSEGKVIGLLGTYEDITGRLALEEQLKLTQFSVDHFTDSSIWLGPEGRVLYVNDAACKSLGYSRDELLSRNIWDIDPDFFPESYSRIWKTLKERGSFTFESLHVTCGGRKFPVEVSANYIRFGDREYLISFDRDITWRKRSEEELRKSEADLARSQEIAHLGSYAWDIQKDEIRWSDELYRIFKYRPREFTVTYEGFLELVAPEDRVTLNEAVAKTLSEHGYLDVDYRIVQRGGTIRYVHTEGQVICDVRGQPVSMFGTTQDITDRKHAEIQLEAAKSQAELYVDLMSHDIGNMNQAMMGYLEMALDMLKPQGEERALLSQPLEIIANSSRLINNVRKLKQLQAGSVPSMTLDLGQVLSGVKADFSSFPGRDVTINFDQVPDCLVEANSMLNDLFANLVDNAIRHSSGKLIVDILLSKVTRDHTDYYRVDVEDNGPGISDQLKEKLLSTVEGGDKKAERRGIGLLLIKSLLDRFNGQMWIEDRVSGDYRKGSRFVVLLPAKE